MNTRIPTLSNAVSAVEASAQVRHTLTRAGHRGASYVREEPLKSVLIAAATGAAAAGAAAWLASRRAAKA